MPHEAWEYGRGRTDPVTQASFNPKQYQKKLHKTIVRPAPSKQVELSRNKSFKLYIIEDTEEHWDQSDNEESAVVVDSTTIHTTLPSRWAYASTSNLDRLGTEVPVTPRALSNFPSCGDLTSTTSKTKHNKTRWKIGKRMKALFWPRRH